MHLNNKTEKTKQIKIDFQKPSPEFVNAKTTKRRPCFIIIDDKVNLNANTNTKMAGTPQLFKESQNTFFLLIIIQQLFYTTIIILLSLLSECINFMHEVVGESIATN